MTHLNLTAHSLALARSYVCSLYWALSVMTNLKGPPAHETRQCLWHQPFESFMVHPLAERVYTIFVFIIGCVLFSCIYGNINQFIMNLYASGLRYRKRMEELEEFAKFHRLSPHLRNKIRNYVDFQWSVTKGINVDELAPLHAQIAELSAHQAEAMAQLRDLAAEVREVARKLSHSDKWM